MKTSKYFNILKPQYLTEWEFFIWRHKAPGNLIMHLISFIGTFATLIAWIITFNHWLLLYLPISSYIGYLGHVCFKEGGARNKDLISPMTTVYLVLIFYYIVIGKYKSMIQEVELKLDTNTVK